VDATRLLEAQLNDFLPAKRLQALEGLLASGEAAGASREAVNLHCHTFFSFNAYGYSPTGLAWLARQRGFKALGIVDFDVLDGVAEFLNACELLGVRGSTGMETRVFIPEFASRDINSPASRVCIITWASVFLPADRRLLPHLSWLTCAGAPKNGTAPCWPVSMHSSLRLRWTMTGTYSRSHLPAMPPSGICWWLTKRWSPGASRIRSTSGGKAGNAVRAGGRPDRRRGQIPEYAAGEVDERGGVGYAQPGPDTFPSLDEVNRLIVAVARCRVPPGWMAHPPANRPKRNCWNY